MLEKESQNHEFLVIVDELLDSINSGDIIANKVGIFSHFVACKINSENFPKMLDLIPKSANLV